MFTRSDLAASSALCKARNAISTAHKRPCFTPQKLSLCVALLSCSLTQSLWALGLGEIHSNSLLGEQLRARIAIIGSDQALAAEDVRASRISATEAEGLGIDLMSDTRGIEVKALNTEQGVALEVRSRHIIDEPFLNFVVKLQWPKGSVYREYTLLLDLPVVPAHMNATQSAVTALSPRIDTKRLEAASDRYRVQIGDSLLSLAEQWVVSHDGFSLEETAQWLVENNPQAFPGGNANQLMAGVLLTWPKSAIPIAPENLMARLPKITSSEVIKTQVSKAGFTVGGEASFIDTPLASVGRFGLQGHDFVVAPAMQSSSTMLIAEHANIPVSNNAEGMRLRLGGEPIRFDENAILTEEGVQESLAAVVQSQLDVTHEVIDQLRRDNTDLRTQLKRLEQSEYLSTLTELVRLQGLQLANIQAKQSQMAQASVAIPDSPIETTRVNFADITQSVREPSVSAAATILSEVNAAGLVAFAPAASGGMLLAGAAVGPNSIPRIDRAVTLAGELPAAASAIGANTLRHWTTGLLASLIMVGVSLLVVLRRYSDTNLAAAKADPASTDSGGFSLDNLAEVTFAQHTQQLTGFNTCVEAFHQQAGESLITDREEILDRQTMAALLEKSLQKADRRKGYQPCLGNNLGLAQRHSCRVDPYLDQAFPRVMGQVFGEQCLARRSTDKLGRHQSAPQPLLPGAEYLGSNVIPFERPNQTDEELKRRIHEKTCNYQPPNPSEADYIVQEDFDNIEQYLNIEMVTPPEIGSDESRENPQND